MPDSLTDALASLSSPTVVTGLSFLTESALRGTPEQLYSDTPLYKALAVSSESEILAIKSRLSVKFGKDFSARRYTALIRDARASLQSTLPASGFIVSTTGAKTGCLANAIIQLGTVLNVRYDEFSAKAVHQKPSPWGTSGPWSDRDDSEATNYLQHNGIMVKSDVSHETAYALALRNPYHQVRDWLTSLVWDGTPRLMNLFPNYFGTKLGTYERGVSKAWMISAVARIMRRGCQAKYLPVLEGPQDQGKSKALRGLVNGHFEGDGGVQWYRDRLPKLDHKDLGQYMQGVWVIEVAELSTFSGKAWEDVKSFISSQVDPFRTPYGRNIQDYPRQVIFAGTTNEEKWGGDRTGLVRFWPLQAGKMDFDGIVRDREQLWAEARFYFDEGHQWYLDSETTALAREEQSARQPDDEYRKDMLDAAEKLYMQGDSWVTSAMVLEEMKIPKDRQRSLMYRVGPILRENGWEKKQKRVKWSETPVWGYRKGGDTD